MSNKPTHTKTIVTKAGTKRNLIDSAYFFVYSDPGEGYLVSEHTNIPSGIENASDLHELLWDMILNKNLDTDELIRFLEKAKEAQELDDLGY